MKQLRVLEEGEIELGSYSPACEGFIDLIKGFFSKNPIKERLTKLKTGKYPDYSVIRKTLEDDLKNTYDNPEWVEKNLPTTQELVTIKALEGANVNQKQITKPEEIVKVANGMVALIKEITNSERPFIELRRKLYSKIENMTDPEAVDEIWLANEKQLTTEASVRFYRKHKKAFPALGGGDGKPYPEWPVSLKNKGVGGFKTMLHFKTDGKFLSPSVSTAKNFATAIRELVDIVVNLDGKLYQDAYIPYWDGLAVDYNDLEYGDEIHQQLASGQDGEVHHLASYAELQIANIICGLYIVMFDKHGVGTPANEGLIGDALHFLFGGGKANKKSSNEQAKERLEQLRIEAEKLQKKIAEFKSHPQNFTLTGKSFGQEAHLRLSINGRPPALSQLASALDKTLKSASDLANKFKKDIVVVAKMSVPLIEKFEKEMVAAMDDEGNVPEEILNKALLPIIAAKPKLQQTYYNSFNKEQHIADNWLGGNPFKMVLEKNALGATWVDESYKVKPTYVPLDKADEIETLVTLLKVIQPYLDQHGLWMAHNGPFDYDSVPSIVYEFDRPVRHLADHMSDEQLSAIFTLYSMESNTGSLYSTLCNTMESVVESVLAYISGSIEAK